MESESGRPEAESVTEAAAAPAAVADANAQLRLRPPRHSVDRRAVHWWTAQALAQIVPLLVALAVAALLIPGARGWLGLAFAIAAMGGVTYVVVMPRWRYRVHRWETTPDAVYAASGWLLQEWRVAPLSRVQTVDTLRGPLQQLFGLATVTVTTASAKGEIKIDGLDRALALEVVQHLTETTQAIPGDAT
jgi:membrane protein YdbS with pleckstrin-like domain